jgi:hypothetical protein
MLSLMLYLNRETHCRGGTEIVRFRNEELGEGGGDMEYGPTDEYGVEIWKEYTNDQYAWERVNICEMKPNRAFIFDSRLMHRAAPIGGFGSNAQDGRLVLTVFFDLPQC